MPGASKWGGEFLVNTITTGNQSDSTITALADGRFVVAWTDYSQTGGDSSGSAVRAQMFSADGSKSGAEFLVNTTATGNQYSPTITALADGRFVVAWTHESPTGGDSSGSAVRAQVFSADGSKSGAEFLVNTTTTNSQAAPTITALADGRFVAAWMDLSQTGGDTSLNAVRAQVFSANGNRSGIEFLVNTTTTGNQFSPTITALADGRFVVAWTDTSQTGGDINDYAVRAQMFTAGGNKSGAEFLVNTTTTGYQSSPAITALADGRFVVAWEDFSRTGGDIDEYAMRAQVFTASGSKSGAEFLVNTTTAGNQYGPAITALADGRFVAAWIDESQTGGDPSLSAVRAQVFSADGSKSGAEFLVNTTTTSYQSSPAITALADGRFIVSWSDGSETGGDTSSYAVRGQVFDPREAGINLPGTAFADHFIGTGFNDILSGGGGNDRLLGEGGNDRLLGGIGNDRLFGGLGKDRLVAGAGNDTVSGGYGNDVLFGQAGRDVFVFDARLGSAKTDRKVNFDTISDFNVRADSLWLDNAVFKKLGHRGSEDNPAKLKKAFFTVGSEAKDRNDYLIYNKNTGILSYDADGSGAKKAVEFAKLAKNLKLTYHDFFVI